MITCAHVNENVHVTLKMHFNTLPLFSSILVLDTPEDLERILGVLKNHFKVKTTVELKNFMTNASVRDVLAAVKELEKLALGFGANTSMDDFFDKSLRETHKCYSKVPYMTGMNSSEIGSILFTFLSMMVPGLADGISQVMG